MMTQFQKQSSKDLSDTESFTERNIVSACGIAGIGGDTRLN